MDAWPDAASFLRFFEEGAPDVGPMMAEADVTERPTPVFWRELDTRTSSRSKVSRACVSVRAPGLGRLAIPGGILAARAPSEHDEPPKTANGWSNVTHEGRLGHQVRLLEPRESPATSTS